MTEKPLQDERQNKRLVWIYGVTVALYWMSLYFYVPTLPTYTASKTSDLARVGMVLSMYGLWQAIIRLPLGIVSDWIGRRKPFILAGFVLSATAALVMGTSGTINGMLIGRAISGLAAGTWVPLVVVFNRLFKPHETVRATALLTLFGSVGRLFATGSTGWLNNNGGYSLPFFLAAGSAGLAFVLVLTAREEPRPPKAPSLRALAGLFTRRDVMLPTILATVSQYATWAAIFGFLPILAEELGATDYTQSIMVSANVAIVIVGNLMATSLLVRRLGQKRTIHITFIMLAVGVATSALSRSLVWLLVFQLLIGLSQGISAPVLMGMSIQRVDESQRTSAMGLHQSIYAFGMFFGPAISGWLAEEMGIRPMLVATAVVAMLVGVVLTTLLRNPAEEPVQQP
ncbi:MAG: MFS transporter [Chloroflexi bacterium]|nr:MFS transporter [Chloroflexota bacterium]